MMKHVTRKKPFTISHNKQKKESYLSAPYNSKMDAELKDKLNGEYDENNGRWVFKYVNNVSLQDKLFLIARKHLIG